MQTTAVLFPGQGSQEKDMGRHIAEKNKELMDLWKKAEQISHYPLREIFWDGNSTDINDTLYLQPALTVCNLSYWINAKLNNTHCAAGHSLGEYSAFMAAEVLSFQRGLELVCLRAKLMSEADPEKRGTMLAVLKVPLSLLEDIVKKVQEESDELIVIANYNTPEQFVCSGTQKAIALLQVKLKEHKGRGIALAVSGAFHSPMLDAAAMELKKSILSIPQAAWNKPKFPIYNNSSAKQTMDIVVLQTELCKQMTSPVFWTETVQQMYRQGVRKFVECGPKNVLSKMLNANLEPMKQKEHEADWSATPLST